jgi:SCP-2 sterol transfer family protein
LGLFKDESDVYACIGRLFQELAEDQQLAPAFKRADTTVRYLMADPDSQITVDLRPGAEIRVDLGPSDLDPEVVMSLSADTAHAFWLGRVNVTAALASGDIVARGPVAKVLRLVPLVEPSFPRYEQILREAGRSELLEAV